MKQLTLLVGNEQKGFFIALGALMSKSWKVCFVADNKAVAQLIKTSLDEYSYELIMLPDRRKTPIPDENTLTKSLCLEEKYNVQLSFLMGQDRALGYGYQVNVEKYPFIKRASWSQLEKLQHMVDQFSNYQNLLKDTDLFVSQFPQTIVSLICESRQIPHFHLSQIKYGDRYFWSDDNYQGSKQLGEVIKQNLLKYTNVSDIPETPYLIDAAGELVNTTVKYNYTNALRRSLEMFTRDTINSLRKRRKENSYPIYGWIPSTFRKVRNHKILCRQGIRPDELSELKLVYFPLHMEPEVALLQFAPEFSNTVEAITWLSKSLPANYVVVVKEQANSFAVRSRQFYQRLLSIPNVRLADPSYHSWEWIRGSEFIVTMTGTVGQEAVHFEKPVISFGCHQVINLLPTVFHVTSFQEVADAVSQILSLSRTDDQLKISRVALYKAQIECSFELPEYKNNYKSRDVRFDTTQIAFRALLAKYLNRIKDAGL